MKQLSIFQNRKVLDLFLLGALVLVGIAVVASITYARVSTRGDQVTERVESVDNVASHLLVAAETTATSTLLIDKSDTTNYPHFSTGSKGLELSQIRADWSTLGAATTTLKFGLVASSSSSGSIVDVYWFDTLTFSGSLAADRSQTKVLNYDPSVMRFDVASGAPVSYITNDKSLNTTQFATTSTLLAPDGYSAPGVGDLVMRIFSQQGTATTSVTTLYKVR